MAQKKRARPGEVLGAIGALALVGALALAGGLAGCGKSSAASGAAPVPQVGLSAPAVSGPQLADRLFLCPRPTAPKPPC